MNQDRKGRAKDKKKEKRNKKGKRKEKKGRELDKAIIEEREPQGVKLHLSQDRAIFFESFHLSAIQ